MEGLGSAKVKALQDPVWQNQTLQWDILRGFIDIKTECKSSLQGSSPQHILMELTTAVSLTSSFRKVRLVSAERLRLWGRLQEFGLFSPCPEEIGILGLGVLKQRKLFGNTIKYKSKETTERGRLSLKSVGSVDHRISNT